MAPANPRYCSDTGGGQPSPPTVTSVQHSGAMVVTEQDAPGHITVQEEDGLEAMALGSGGEEGGHL